MPDESRLMPDQEANSTSHPHGQGLRVENLGGNTAVRKQHDSDERERELFAAIPSSQDSRAVLATTASIREAGFLDTLWHACRRAMLPAPTPNSSPTAPRPPRQLWIAVGGLTRPGPRGNSVAAELAAELDADVLVPDGRLELVPGGSLYVTGGQWRLYRAGQQPRPHVVRYPTPLWEKQLPAGPVADSGLLAEPVPAGLRIREDGQEPSPRDEDLAVPQSPHHPRLLLGSPDAAPIPTARLASMLTRISGGSRRPWELVPTTVEEAAPARLRELAERLGSDVLATTGSVLHDGSGGERSVVPDPHSAWEPFPVSLWHSVTGTARVGLTAPAPRGWVRFNQLVYRHAEAGPAIPAPGEMVARVVPGGLALLPFAQAGFRGVADGIAFEQHRMTVSVGSPYVPVPPEAPHVLRQLLDGLTPGQRGRVRLLILGIADERTRGELTTIAGEPNGGAPAYPPISTADGAPDTTSAPLTEADAPDAPPNETTAHIPAVASDTSAGGGASAGGGTSAGETPIGEADDEQRPTNHATPLPTHRPRTVGEPPPELLSEQAGRPSPIDTAAHPTGEQHSGVPDGPADAPPEPVSDRESDSPTSEKPAGPRLVPAQAGGTGTPHNHRSTSEERSRFAQAVGDDFDEVLPSVNTVLATHPALRENEADEAKADFVAVILYTGCGENGGNAVNRLLRTGKPGAARDYVSCLLSGLRRLPVHRGPSFRFGGSPDGDVDGYEPGAVLSEPGFLSATAAEDLTTDDEHGNSVNGDVVIWSHSARRVSLFGRNSLPEEVVFASDARFKVLATADEENGRPALLLRELRQDERTTHGELDEADLAVLPKLQRALRRRHGAEPRVLSERDQLDRMSSPVGLVPTELRGDAEAPPTASGAEPAQSEHAAGAATTTR
ncbi:hypothetical protein SAMN04487820_105338 [Actinopolyspora mzabensis]|uniref:NAD(+)--protein-arginine ADP-ribosyltransferase n=1 Tax=Actinopolyspora mzabensis TaxID=995066 RepID=A0A1G9A6B7_ACTMZ|nr:hypothetical protein [Actinopolyspora mzabensis]SDK22833.1 hypothetical protein SAMN04487820_105338 [Actinopolyspora mzabensis]